MKNQDLSEASEALLAMGFERMSEDEDGLLDYWLPVPPFTQVVLHNNAWNERNMIISTLARHIDIVRVPPTDWLGCIVAFAGSVKRASVERGLADIAVGRVVPHSEVRKRFALDL